RPGTPVRVRLHNPSRPLNQQPHHRPACQSQHKPLPLQLRPPPHLPPHPRNLLFLQTRHPPLTTRHLPKLPHQTGTPTHSTSTTTAASSSTANPFKINTPVTVHSKRLTQILSPLHATVRRNTDSAWNLRLTGN